MTRSVRNGGKTNNPMSVLYAGGGNPGASRESHPDRDMSSSYMTPGMVGSRTAERHTGEQTYKQPPALSR